jgi:Zn finger protein HypA/HybF involved in hydrogenase expression
VHELTLAAEVCRIAERHVRPEELARIVAVGVEVGDDAGVEPSALEFCLEVLLAEPPFAGAKPVIVAAQGDVLRLSYLEVDDGRPDH